MKNLFKLVKKDMKLLLRSKASALIVILGPLLIIFLAGAAFDNTKTYSVSIATYSSSYNDITNDFVDTLNENKFKVTKFESQESCIDSIKDGISHSCVVFSPDFKMGQNMKNEMTFYIDYSKVNLVYMVLDTLTETIGEKSSELSMNLTTVLLNTIDLTKAEVTERKSTIITLTEKNDEILKKVDSTYNELNTLDTDTELTAAAVSTLEDRKDKLSTQINNLEGVAEDALDEADSLIDELRDEIESSSLSEEEKQNLLSLLSSSEEDIISIEEDFDSTTNLTDNNLAELTTAVSNVAVGMEDAKKKLNEAGSAKKASITNLNGAKALINEVISNIAVLQQSLNEIESSINSIKVKDASNIVSPVETTIKPVVAEKTHLNYIFPVLVVLVLMFTGILLSTTLIMLEKKTSAYFRNFISPTKDITFITATFITCFTLLFIQAAIIIGISTVFFGTEILYSMHKAVPVIMLCITLFTLAGMVVGYVFNSEETATLGAISLGSIFLLLSDVILPLESMPSYVFDIAQFNPFVIGGSLLRKTLIHNVPFISIENGLVYLFIYCASIFVIVIIVQSITKKHLFSRYLNKIAAKPEHKHLNK